MKSQDRSYWLSLLVVPAVVPASVEPVAVAPPPDDSGVMPPNTSCADGCCCVSTTEFKAFEGPPLEGARDNQARARAIITKAAAKAQVVLVKKVPLPRTADMAVLPESEPKPVPPPSDG